METMSVLIADSSEEFRSTLANALQGNYRVHACRTGKEALDILQRTPPDVLILDLMLPELDGISLLQTVSAAGVRPTVLATTRLANDYVVEATTKLGVEYLMIKPCDIRAIVSRVNDLCCHRPRPSISAPDNRTHISNLLISLGISTKLRGYPYLREAVLRSIRNAIQGAWNQRNEALWAQVFQPDEHGGIPRPSNAAFITRLADRLVLDQMQIPLP